MAYFDGTTVTNHSFDELAGSLLAMFEFDHPQTRKLFLDPKTGLPLSRGADQ